MYQNQKQEYVVDFQAFKDKYNKFILKEIAIISIHVNQIVHLMVLPPYPFKALPPSKQREADWLTKHMHSISWNSGYVSHELAVSLLRAVITRAHTLFIKGSERKSYLQRLMPLKKVIDLDTLNCPKADAILRPVDAPICFYSPHWKNAGMDAYACALDRAYKFKIWLKLYSSINSTSRGINSEPQSFTDSDDYSEEEEHFAEETSDDSSAGL